MSVGDTDFVGFAIGWAYNLSFEKHLRKGRNEMSTVSNR